MTIIQENVAKGLSHYSRKGARDKGTAKRGKEVGTTEVNEKFNMAPWGRAG